MFSPSAGRRWSACGSARLQVWMQGTTNRALVGQRWSQSGAFGKFESGSSADDRSRTSQSALHRTWGTCGPASVGQARCPRDTLYCSSIVPLLFLYCSSSVALVHPWGFPAALSPAPTSPNPIGLDGRAFATIQTPAHFAPPRRTANHGMKSFGGFGAANSVFPPTDRILKPPCLLHLFFIIPVDSLAIHV